MPRWEYQTFWLDDSGTNLYVKEQGYNDYERPVLDKPWVIPSLNELGAAGWELFTTYQEGERTYAIAKRFIFLTEDEEVTKREQERPTARMLEIDKNKLNVVVGDRVRQAREELGWSQGELAQILGYLAPSTISYYEIGGRTVSLELLYKLCILTGWPLEQFLPSLEEILVQEQPTNPNRNPADEE